MIRGGSRKVDMFSTELPARFLDAIAPSPSLWGVADHRSFPQTPHVRAGAAALKTRQDSRGSESNETEPEERCDGLCLATASALVVG